MQEDTQRSAFCAVSALGDGRSLLNACFCESLKCAVKGSRSVFTHTAFCTFAIKKSTSKLGSENLFLIGTICLMAVEVTS